VLRLGSDELLRRHPDGRRSPPGEEAVPQREAARRRGTGGHAGDTPLSGRAAGAFCAGWYGVASPSDGLQHGAGPPGRWRPVMFVLTKTKTFVNESSTTFVNYNYN